MDIGFYTEIRVGLLLMMRSMSCGLTRVLTVAHVNGGMASSRLPRSSPRCQTSQLGHRRRGLLERGAE